MSELASGVSGSVRDAAEQLRAAGVTPEALAEYVPERRKLLVPLKATMRPLGQVWRLGTVLIGADPASPPTLFVAGRATRAQVRLHPGNQSVSREERRDIAAAAIHGGYAEGTPVNFEAVAVPLTDEGLASLDASLPLGVSGGELRVRWRAGAPLDGAATLAAYLAERVDLAVHPPQGA